MRGYFQAACMAFFCFSCTPAINEEVVDDHVYTVSELYNEFGIVLEWRWIGRCEVYNETSGPVMMTITYPYWAQREPLTVVMNSGEYTSLKIGSLYTVGEDLSACAKTAFIFENGTEIVITPDMGEGWPNAWSEYFLTNINVQDDYEIIEQNIDGVTRKIRHDLVVVTYHINETLVNLWRSAH